MFGDKRRKREQREIEEEAARRIRAEKIEAEVQRQKAALEAEAAEKKRAADERAARARAFAATPEGKAASAAMLTGLISLVAWVTALFVGASMPQWLFWLLAVPTIAIVFLNRDRILKKASTTVLFVGVLVFAGGASIHHGMVAHDLAVQNAQQAAFGAAHARQAKANHERRLEWNHAHPAEAAKARATERARVRAQEAAYEAAHPSADVVAGRLQRAAAEFASMYPINDFIMDVHPNKDDPTIAVVVIDKGEWDSHSPSFQVATTQALESQWEDICQRHQLPGECKSHLGFQFNDFFDTH